MDTFSDYDLLWQLGTAVVLIGALIFLVLAYRRRQRPGLSTAADPVQRLTGAASWP
ncbi:MAG: hypothetical protein WKF47_04255 [Geodermatophilaceae bacterium]